MDTQMQVQIVEKKAIQLVGLRYEGKNEHGEIPALWDQFMPRLGELAVDPAHWVGYGVGREIPGVDVSQKWEYLAALEVPSGSTVPEGMVIWEIPALTYAVVPAQDVPGIGPASSFFYQEWLPNSSQWEGSEPFMMEVYPETYSQDLIIYLFFPVKPKSA